MAGVLQVFIPLKYWACIVNNVGGNRTIIKQTLRRLHTISSRPVLDFSRKRRAYFSSKLELAVNTKMTDKTEVFQPLPINVVPHHYELTLRLDLDNFTFEGKQNIHVKVNQTTDTVVMNATDLDVKSVTFTDKDGQQLNAEECKTDDSNLLTIKFPRQLSSGNTGHIHMQFKGIINDSMKGLYRCKSTSPEGETKYAAVTQFEAIDARRCFPCWDEPAHKATFDITLTVPTNLTALSNMPVKHKKIEGDLTTINFLTTPKMSTYLVALVVGEFDYVEDKIENGVVIRVYTPKGKSKQGELALEFATKSLSYYNKYFGLSYPLPKLDCVGVADFAAGAMENWGLVTYRESCILFDEQHTSTANKQWIGLVVAHELAHQWFGNLVTMNWWTDLWLNEGYATFTEYVCMGDLYPQFDTWKQFVTDVLCRALELDGLKNSHPIEVPINNPDEIEEIFDDISYNKAASVIRMLYFWLGKEDFMRGMNSYLKDNAYANADTAILWRSLETASKKPVSKIMPSWTKQTGYPILTVDQRQEGTNRVLTISQQRFLADGSQDENNTLWIVPLNVTTSVDSSAIAMSMLLNEKRQEFVIPNVPEGSWVNMNPDKVGFYRTNYSREMIYALLPAIENKTLPALDRYSFLDDLFNSAKAGYTSTVDVLNVLQAYKQEDDYIVWNSIVTCLSRIRSLISHLPFHEDYKAFCRNIFKSISQKVGWEAKPGESHLDTLLRTMVINRMVMLQDEDTVAEAKRRFDLHVSGASLIPADLRSCVYRAVVNNGDENTLQTMLELYEKVELAEEKDRILSSLGVVRDTKLLQKVLEHSLTESVRAQDIIYVFQSTSWSAESRDYSWKFIKDNWAAYNTKIKTINLLTRLVKWATEDFVSEAMAQDVEKFFTVHPNSAIDRPAKQSIEKIRMNVEWLRRDKENIEKFLLKSK